MQRYLVTGGAGFIGTRLVRRLVQAGEVHVFDSLHPQVHGPSPVLELPDNAPLVRGDIRDEDVLGKAFASARPTVVVHLAAETGTGQSYDEVSRYCEVNVTGTARLIEAIRRHGSDVRRVVLASSRAVYGEGPYRYPDGRIALAPTRSIERMERGDFEVRCPETGFALEPVPASGIYGVAPASVYGSTKLMQEYLLMQSSQGADWTTAVLRLQNVFGPGQSLRNPYTGVLSIFCAQLLGGAGIDIYEDGAITRDFVFVDDVVDALVRAADVERAVPALPVDIGSAEPCTILTAANHLVRCLVADPSRIAVTGRFRAGDIRFAAADIAQATSTLDWQPRVPLEEGLRRLAEWSARNHHG